MAAGPQLISLIRTNNLTIEEYSILSKRFCQKEYGDFVTFIIQELDISYSSKVLNVGCGPGWVSLELARRMPETKIIAVDFDKEIIQVANKNKKLEKLDNVEFVYNSSQDLKQLNHRSFDAIISYGALQHLNNPERILKDIKHLVTKKGKYAISLNRSDLKILAKFVIWFNARGMPKDFRAIWQESFRKSFVLVDLLSLLLKAELKDWKIRSTLFDFLVYKI